MRSSAFLRQVLALNAPDANGLCGELPGEIVNVIEFGARLAAKQAQTQSAMLRKSVASQVGFGQDDKSGVPTWFGKLMPVLWLDGMKCQRLHQRVEQLDQAVPIFQR